MKQLIVNADDFGRSAGVNRGIIEAHRKGIVTSTTVMINLPDAPAGLEQAQTQAPHLGIGLHLNLTAGRPVSPTSDVPSLVNEEGLFFSLREWPAAAEQFDPGDLRREITAQFDRFTEWVGHPPDHLDAHHHATYLHPAALKIMLEIAAEHRLPLRQGRLDDAPDNAFEMLDLPPETVERLLAQLLAVLAEGPAPLWPARFESGFYGQHATLGDLLVILTTLPDDSVTELMCHPGYADDGLAGSQYTTQREDELGHLTHAATRECVQSEDIRLITFGDLVP